LLIHFTNTDSTGRITPAAAPLQRIAGDAVAVWPLPSQAADALRLA
jgi:hypothetical protein